MMIDFAKFVLPLISPVTTIEITFFSFFYFFSRIEITDQLVWSMTADDTFFLMTQNNSRHVKNSF